MATITINKTVRPLLGALTDTVVLGEASKTGRWVYVASDGLAYETAADEAATSADGPVGLIVAGHRQSPDGLMIVGETGTVVWYGPVAMPGSDLTPGAYGYLSDTVSTVNGLMADAAGTVTRKVGRALATEKFFVNPDLAPATSS